jgi:FKBP-type peptidyl-prolyl cis-trans isomerase
MKTSLQIVLGLVLIAAVSFAQEAPKDKNQAHTNAVGAGPENAQHSTINQKKPVQGGGAKSEAKAGTRALTEKEKNSYALGVQFSTDIAREGFEVDPHLLLQGMADGLSGGKLLMSLGDINAALAKLQKVEREKFELALKEFAKKNKQDGEAYLAANKSKEGVVTLPSGLQYKVLKETDGKKPGPNDQVVCNYRGTLLDGTEVDSSYKRKEPSIFPLKGVIKGWAEALQLMPVGSKWQVVVPSDLAYGERGSPSRSIGPNATLVFEVELVSIEEKSQTVGAR